MISDEEVNKYSNFAKSLRSLNVIRNDTLELGMCNYIEMAPFDRSHPSSWFRMALSYIVFDIKRYVVENRDFYTPPAFDAPVRRSLSECCHNVWYGKN